MQPERIAEGVFLIPLPASNVYLWESAGQLTLIDTGVPGSEEAILQAIGAIGHSPGDVVEIVLTHFHRDHTGSAAALARRTGARVLAHVDDAAIIEGTQPPPKPRLTRLERPLAEMLLGTIEDLPGPQPEGVRVDRRVAEGDVTLAGGQIIAIPGHTRGSIAVLLSDLQVLFTGDSLASSYDSTPILGPFNLNPHEAVAALRKQAQLPFDIACVGHGRPIIGNASRKVLAVVRSLPDDDWSAS